jgi:hypothetical protein
MKKAIIVPALALMAFSTVPTESFALSCIDPEGMIEHIVSEPDYVVVTATPTEQVERVKEKATQEGTYDCGYTGQLLNVSEAHMGASPESLWVYFHRDFTWNYLCAGEPPKIGTEHVYVINVSTNIFDPSTVVMTYEADSQMAEDLLEAIEDADSEVEPSTYDVSVADWTQRLKDELKEMAFLVELKLAELKYWLTK